MHQILMRDVAIGKNDNIDAVLGNELLEVFLIEDRNAVGIQAT